MALQDRDTALVTKQSVKAYLGIDNANEDTRVDDLIKRASGAISSYCGRKFAQATHTSYFDGNGTTRLYLPHYPITTPFSGVATAGVWVDSMRAFGTATALTEETIGGSTSGQYLVYGDEDGCGKVIRIDGVWPRDHRTIKIIWQGGYATIPDELQHCALRTIGAWLEVATSKMHASTQESLISGGSISLIDHHNLAEDVKDILSRWRRPWTCG